jgi:hypothetical protein
MRETLGESCGGIGIGGFWGTLGKQVSGGVFEEFIGLWATLGNLGGALGRLPLMLLKASPSHSHGVPQGPPKFPEPLQDSARLPDNLLRLPQGSQKIPGEVSYRPSKDGVATCCLSKDFPKRLLQLVKAQADETIKRMGWRPSAPHAYYGLLALALDVIPGKGF